MAVVAMEHGREQNDVHGDRFTGEEGVERAAHLGEADGERKRAGGRRKWPELVEEEEEDRRLRTSSRTDVVDGVLVEDPGRSGSFSTRRIIETNYNFRLIRIRKESARVTRAFARLTYTYCHFFICYINYCS